MFTGEHSCQSVISIKLQSKFIEIGIRHGCSPVNMLHIFRKPFPRNTPGWLVLTFSILVLHETKENINLQPVQLTAALAGKIFTKGSVNGHGNSEIVTVLLLSVPKIFTQKQFFNKHFP